MRCISKDVASRVYQPDGPISFVGMFADQRASIQYSFGAYCQQLVVVRSVVAVVWFIGELTPGGVDAPTLINQTGTSMRAVRLEDFP